ncbi:MAG: polyprenyl synthetase family protein [Chlorobi bacterium]|nr:polyprenyl synthetase family protein [Chlorobiota bacterium]MCI0716985.1 polyprenyl synthetase family protein [Chlorobiota bacterium]
MINNFVEYRGLIERKLTEFLAEESYRSKSLNNTFTYSLYNPINYVMSGGGKRIRPILVLLACEAFGGKAQDAINAAIAVEILHNFTLVHDDIMDNASTRRGKETVHQKWDVNSAILVGDELIGLSYRSLILSNTSRIASVVKVFTDGVIEVCEGQAMDKEFETRDEVSIYDYIIMIRKKTAELLKTSAVIGAIIGGSSDEEVKKISVYAENVGLAFQIQDDLLDIIANENEFGKKIGGDIVERKKSYLYTKALELLQGSKKNEFIKCYSSNVTNGENVSKIINVYNELCVIETARNEIKRLTAVANKSLDCIKDNHFRLKLEQFSDMLLNRNY